MNANEFGARLNRLRKQMKEVKARTAFRNSSLSHPFGKVDGNNNNYKLQDIKLNITPNYSQMKNKIAEVKESKLLKALREIQIPSNKNNKGSQKHNNQEKEDNVVLLNHSKSSKTFLEVPSPNQPNKKLNKMLPHPKLRKNSESESMSSSTDLSRTKSQILQPIHDFKLKQYRKLGQIDKYCEQFMYFLDEDNDSLNRMEEEKITIKQQVSIDWYQSQEQKSTKEGEQTVDIKDRVKMAIHNSLKLMKGLKNRQSRLPQ